MLRKIKILAILKIFLLASSCANKPPTWNGKLWAGNSETASIDRAQDGQKIKCSEDNFNDYICMSYEDYQLFIKTYVLGCSVWSKDAKLYQSKLKKCGLLTDENIETINQCINK